MKLKFMLATLCILLLAIPGYASATENTYIVTLKDTVDFYGLSPKAERDYIVVSGEELAEYLDAGIVAKYEPNYRVELFGDNWNLDAVNCEFAWELGCFGNEVRIGVIDSGLYPYPELEDNIIAGKNYLDGSSDTTDHIGHGTFVVGIIASESTGISYKSKIVPLKCFELGEKTYIADIIDAIYDAVDIYDCQVINMSFGFASNSELVKKAIDYVTDKGAIVVAAVGNKGNEQLYYPASYDNVIGVGSINEDLEVSEFSQHNTSVFVTAPGENINSVLIDGYLPEGGTSFAAPHVSALAAIVKCVDSDICTNDLKTLLSVTSTDLGVPGYDVYYGYGVVNCEKIINRLLKNEIVYISPIDKGGGKCQSVIYNNSDEDLNVSCIYACYNELSNLLEKCIIQDVVIAPYSVYSFENEYTTGTIKCMVWENMKSLCPLSKCQVKK